MKEKYIGPIIEIVEIKKNDIITTSGDADWTNPDNVININDGYKWSPFHKYSEYKIKKQDLSEVSRVSLVFFLLYIIIFP